MAKSLILKRLIDRLGYSIYQFEKEIGVSQSSLNKAIERNSTLKLDVIEKIVQKFPNVNKDWLLTGEGKIMYDDPFDELEVKEGKRKEVIALGKQVPLRLKPEDYSTAFGDWAGVPMYMNTITASFVETYRDENVFMPQYYLHDPRFKGCNFGAKVAGDSMHSEIRHGDIVICQEVVDTRFVVYGDIYYIVSTNGLETCKYLSEDEMGNYLLIARNENIRPSPLPKDMLLRLYKVKGILREY